MADPAPCVYADDAYLIQAFPGVVVLTPEAWLVTVLAAQAGEYATLLGAASYPYTADNLATTGTIADNLLLALGASPLAAVAPAGAASVLVQATTSAPLDLTVTGPAVDTIEAVLQSGGDSNEAARTFWLARAQCGLPPCCMFTACRDDFTLMHAALAAHYLFTFGSLSGAGTAATAFSSMRLGPASLSKGNSAYTGNPADTALDTTAPGSLYLMLRARYVLPIFCV